MEQTFQQSDSSQFCMDINEIEILVRLSASQAYKLGRHIIELSGLEPESQEDHKAQEEKET